MGFLLRGMLIGLLFGLPVGAVGALTVQRAWGFGVKAGLLTGLGSSVADCFYACVGAFGLTLISDFLLQWQTVIAALGGALILLMGCKSLFFPQGELPPEEDSLGGTKLFLTSFAIGITNPAAILTFLFAFSYFGIGDVQNLWEGSSLVAGVFLRHLLLVGNPYRPDPLGAAQGRKTATFHYESNLRCGVVPIWRNRVLTAAPLPHFLKAVTTHETAFCLTDLSPGDSVGPCGLRTKRPAREQLPYDLFGGKRVPRGSAGTYPRASGQQRDIPFSQLTA